MNHGIDLSFRPQSYFPESRTREQLLSNIKGQARREMVAETLDDEGVIGLDDFIARPSLTEEERQGWGQFHPWMMGGEYLPDLEGQQVEIARISLQSTTFDQISIRAKAENDSIYFSVADEYEEEYQLAFETAKEPLTLKDLIEFIDGSNQPGQIVTGGLLVSNWNYMFGEDYPVDQSVAFASIESGFYNHLAEYYETYAVRWGDECLAERLIKAYRLSQDEWRSFFSQAQPNWTLEELSKLDEERFEKLFKEPTLTSKVLLRSDHGESGLSLVESGTS